MQREKIHVHLNKDKVCMYIDTKGELNNEEVEKV